MAESLHNSPSYKGLHWQKLIPAWTLVRDLFGSPLEIREKGATYLRQFPKEPNEKFKARLNESVIRGEFRDAIEKMAGMVFRTDPKPADLPDDLDVMMTDIDMRGNSLWAFIIKAFIHYLRDGNGYIYIDAPPLSKKAAERIANGERPTLKDRENDRPFWVFYEASQVINIRYENTPSGRRIAQVTLQEEHVEAEGDFGEKTIIKYRVLRPGKWWLYKTDNNNSDNLSIEEEGSTGLDFVPLIALDDITNNPPMLELAMINVQHYNKTSDYDNICHIVCTPTRVQKYATAEDATKAGEMQVASPGVGIKIWGDGASVSYAEVKGDGMELARTRYLDLETQMAKIGIGMFSPNMSAPRTAAEIVDTTGKQQSRLSLFTRMIENGIEQAIYMTAQYFNEILGSVRIDLENAEAKTRVKLKVDYDRLTISIDQLMFFSDLVDSNKLSLETFLKYMGLSMAMPPEFSPEDEMKKIAGVNRIIDIVPD